MPVRKFRDISEMKDTWYVAGSSELVVAIRRVWSFADRTCPLSFPHGVYKHRSQEAADELRSRWERSNFLAHQERLRAAARRASEPR